MTIKDGARVAVEEMTRWVADPNQFGVSPSDVQVVASFCLQWPWHDQEQDIYLVQYKIPRRHLADTATDAADRGQIASDVSGGSSEGASNWVTGIGFSGPVTWSLPVGEVDFSKFEHGDLVKIYAGWYLLYELLNSDSYDPQFDENEDAEMIEILENEHGLQDVQILERVQIGDQTFYEMTAIEEGQLCKLAGSTDGCFSCDASDRFFQLPALYTFLGFAFYEEDEDEETEDD